MFGELQDALDRIWRAPVQDRAGGLWGLVRARLLSFGMVLGIAFLLMVSLVMGAAVSASMARPRIHTDRTSAIGTYTLWVDSASIGLV